MFKQKKTIGIAAITYGLGLAVVAADAPADAAFARGAAVGYCRTRQPASEDLLPGTTGNGSIMNHESSSVLNVYCSVPTNSHLRHNYVDTLNVHGYESTSDPGSYSKACSHNYNSTSYGCGGAKQWGSGSGGAYNHDLTHWSNGGRFPYIFIRLEPNSKVYGFYMAD